MEGWREAMCMGCLGKGFVYTSKGHAMSTFPHWPVAYT
jgi:hypothetical protein